MVIQPIKLGDSFVAPEDGYYVNEPWMDEADLALTELDEAYKELDKQPSKTWATRIFWLGIGLASGIVIAK